VFYKKYRRVLDADVIHLRRPDGQDWDGIMHVDSQGKEKGLAFFYNPLKKMIKRNIALPLYYTGLTEEAKIREKEGLKKKYKLNRDYSVDMHIEIPANGYTWFVIE